MSLQKRMAGIIATCLGLGLIGSWWLMMRTVGPLWWQNAGFSWYGTLFLDLAYIAVQIVCLFAYKWVGRFFDNRLSYVLLGSLQTLIVIFASVLGTAGSGVAPFLLCCASLVNSLLFLGWSRPLTCILEDSPHTSVVLASMAGGMVAWVLIALIPSAIAFYLVAFLPVVVGFLSLKTPQYARPASTTKKDISNFDLLPPLFLAGALILELAPGFIMGVANAANTSQGLSPLQNPYVLCTCIMLGVSVIAFLVRDVDKLQRMLEWFIMPVLSLGLLAFSMLTPASSVVGSALTLAGSNIFEACFFCQFARISHERGVEPIRVFALGGLAIQLGSFIAYLFGPIAHGQESIAATISLVLVFILILYGTFTNKGFTFGNVKPSQNPVVLNKPEFPVIISNYVS